MNSIVKSVVLTIPPIYIAFQIIAGFDVSLRVGAVQGLVLFVFGCLFFVNATSLCNKLMLQTTMGRQFMRKYSLNLSACMDISNKWEFWIFNQNTCCRGHVTFTHPIYLYFFVFLFSFSASHRLVSAIQALLSVIFGAIVCRYSCSRNFLTTSHIFSESYAW